MRQHMNNIEMCCRNGKVGFVKKNIENMRY